MKRQLKRSVNRWKRRTAVGITSQIPKMLEQKAPNQAPRHWVLIDVDDRDKLYKVVLWMRTFETNYLLWESPHGLHGVVLFQCTFKRALDLASECPGVDRKWLQIGKKRGYLFLATYKMMASNLFTYMVIFRGKKK